MINTKTITNAITGPIALFMSLLQILEYAIPVSTYMYIQVENKYLIEHNIFVSYV